MAVDYRARSWSPAGADETLSADAAATRARAMARARIRTALHPVKCSVLSAQCSELGARCLICSVRCSVFGVQCSVFSVRCSATSEHAETSVNHLHTEPFTLPSHSLHADLSSQPSPRQPAAQRQVPSAPASRGRRQRPCPEQPVSRE